MLKKMMRMRTLTDETQSVTCNIINNLFQLANKLIFRHIFLLSVSKIPRDLGKKLNNKQLSERPLLRAVLTDERIIKQDAVVLLHQNRNALK